MLPIFRKGEVWTKTKFLASFLDKNAISRCHYNVYHYLVFWRTLLVWYNGFSGDLKSHLLVWISFRFVKGKYQNLWSGESHELEILSGSGLLDFFQEKDTESGLLIFCPLLLIMLFLIYHMPNLKCEEVSTTIVGLRTDVWNSRNLKCEESGLLSFWNDKSSKLKSYELHQNH